MLTPARAPLSQRAAGRNGDASCLVLDAPPVTQPAGAALVLDKTQLGEQFVTVDGVGAEHVRLRVGVHGACGAFSDAPAAAAACLGARHEAASGRAPKISATASPRDSREWRPSYGSG